MLEVLELLSEIKEIKRLDLSNIIPYIRQIKEKYYLKICATSHITIAYQSGSPIE